MARVASRGESHAVIVMAGMPLTAQIPPEVEAGATLKLKIQEVTPERVTLQIDPQQPAQAPSVGLRRPPLELRPHLQVEEPPARRRGATGSRPTSSRSRSTRRCSAASTCASSCAASVCWPK